MNSQSLSKFAVPASYEKIKEVTGDLDQDGINEKVLIYNAEKNPDKERVEGFNRKLYILKRINGEYRLWKQDSTIVFASNKGFYPGDNELKLIIKNNTLQILQKFYSNSRHSDTSKVIFRFQQGDFYLIGSTTILEDTCLYRFKYDLNFSLSKIIVDETYSSCDEDDQIVPKDYYKEFTHKTPLFKMGTFKIGEQKIKIPNSKKYIYF